MNKEFKTIKGSSHTRYVLETTTAGATGSAAIATAEKPLGELQKRQSVSVPVTQKPRQGPLRQQTGAGQHRDKKKEQKSGKEKHRKPFAEQGVAEGSLTEGQYEMMMRNGQVKKFIAKDDADAKRIAAGHGAKSVIRLRSGVPAGKVSEQGVAEGFDSEYDDEAGMAQSNLLTTARAVMGLLKTIKARDNLPEWGQEKIAKAEMMLVSVWDYLQSQKELGMDPKVRETMLPKSAFAGSDKNKLGPAAHLKGSMKRPARQGDLVGGMEEGLGSKLAGLGLAGAMAIGAGGANARVSGDQDPNINRLTGKPNTTQVAPTDSKPAPEASKGFSKEYLQKASDPNRFGRYLISVEKAQELLKKMDAVDEEKSLRNSNPCWKGYKPVGTKQKGGRTVPNCVPKEGVDVEESGLQYYTGVKKHGKEYMVKAAQAARKGASQAELGALKDKYSKAYKEDDSSNDNPQHSHQYKTTMKHADRPTVQQRMAAHDIKPGVAGYRDRIDLLKDLERTGKLKEGLRPEEQKVIDQLIDGDLDAYDVMTRPQGPAQEKVSVIIQDKYENVSLDHRLHPDDDFERILDIVLDQLADDYGHSGDMEEAAPKGWEGTVKAMKKHKEIDNPYALAHYMKNKGYKSHKEDAYMESLFKALETQSKK